MYKCYPCLVNEQARRNPPSGGRGIQSLFAARGGFRGLNPPYSLCVIEAKPRAAGSDEPWTDFVVEQRHDPDRVVWHREPPARLLASVFTGSDSKGHVLRTVLADLRHEFVGARDRLDGSIQRAAVVGVVAGRGNDQSQHATSAAERTNVQWPGGRATVRRITGTRDARTVHCSVWLYRTPHGRLQVRCRVWVQDAHRLKLLSTYHPCIDAQTITLALETKRPG